MLEVGLNMEFEPSRVPILIFGAVKLLLCRNGLKGLKLPTLLELEPPGIIGVCVSGCVFKLWVRDCVVTMPVGLGKWWLGVGLWLAKLLLVSVVLVKPLGIMGL